MSSPSTIHRQLAVLLAILGTACFAPPPVTRAPEPEQAKVESASVHKGSANLPAAKPAPADSAAGNPSPSPAGFLRAPGRATLAAQFHSLQPFGTEQYDFTAEQGFLDVVRHPLSTFSVDVDTASYANVRRILREGRLPSKGAVRIEELLNYFAYDYPEANGEEPF
jgi:Ca-activated chloride channel family protein